MSSAIAAAPSHNRSRCWSRNAGCPSATRRPSQTPSPSTKPASNTLTTACARGTSRPLTLMRISALRGSSTKSWVPCVAAMPRSSQAGRPVDRPSRTPIRWTDPYLGGVPMPATPLPQNVLDLLARPNPAVMATIAADGRPVTVATWYLLEPDGTILLGLDAGRARLEHLRRDPRVSLTALAEDDWYTHVSVQGRVV